MHVVSRIFFLLIFILGLTACTVANTDVAALAQASTFASKSTSPFEQEMPGDYFILSGYCLSTVTGFAFRLDDLSVWTNIPSAAPSPGANEYLVGTPEYDVDCSDGTYNFYIFKSQAMQNYADNSVTGDDPFKIEMRALAPVSLPSLIYERPEPSQFRISPYNGNWMIAMESNTNFLFTVTLLSSSMKEAKPYQRDVVISLSAANLSNAANPSGSFYNTDCSTPLTAADLTFSTSGHVAQKNFCYRSVSVPGYSNIRLSTAANDMITQNYDMGVFANYTAQSWVSASNNQDIPNVLVKGAQYKLYMGMSPLNTMNSGYVEAYNGSFAMQTTGSAYVGLVRGENSDAECPGSAVTGSITCTVTSPMTKSILMGIAANYPGSSLQISAVQTPAASCSTSGCSIYDSGSSHPIASYLNPPRYFQVVSGSTAYSQPLLQSNNSRYRVYNCNRLSLSLANNDGTPIPTPAVGRTMTITVSDGALFYNNNYCSGSPASGVNSYAYKVALQPDGKALVSGTFGSYNYQGRNGLMRLNPDGTLDTTFDAGLGAHGSIIKDILVLPDGKIMVAGYFGMFNNDSSKVYIARLNANGSLDSTWSLNVDGAVVSMALVGNTLYMGGSFTQVNGNARNRLAALDMSSATPTLLTWAPNVNNAVYTLYAAGGVLYVGGGFNYVDGIPRNSIAAFDTTTGAMTSFDPNANNIVTAFAMNGTTLYVGGVFTSIGGQARSYFGAVDTTTGLATSLNTSFDSVINEIHVLGTSLYVAGNFTTVGGVSRTGLVKFDPSTGVVDAGFNAQADNAVESFIPSAGGLLVAGDFVMLGGQNRGYFGKVNSTTGSLETSYNATASSNISMSFTQYDMMKPLYMRLPTMPANGTFTLTITDDLGGTWTRSLYAEPYSP